MLHSVRNYYVHALYLQNFLTSDILKFYKTFENNVNQKFLTEKNTCICVFI